MTVHERLAVVEHRITAACHAAKRPRECVKLVAVSKRHSPEAVREAYGLGLRVFGENYAQELLEKCAALSDLPDIEWHFIGHLQSNKAKQIVRYANCIQTCDSPSLARELGKRASLESRVPKILIEVNVGGESQKHGCSPSELGEVIESVVKESSLQLAGLMTMPPDDPDAARRAFEGLATLRALHGGATLLPELSMGMSQDLEAGIKAGATIVRVGTAIFGSRE